MARLLALLLLLWPMPSAARAPVLVAAAADLRYAMADLAALYAKETNRQVRVTYGSSGIFFQQLQQGAPFHLYLSADEDYVLKLHAAGHTADEGAIYGIGRIVLVAPPASRLAVDERLNGLEAALAKGEIRRFAIASPDHAPYGARASEALRHRGLWPALEPRLVYGENVAQALQFATAGGADGGIVALSLVLSPAFQGHGRYALIPEGWHTPLRQRMVLTKRAGPDAQHFYRWLQSPPARQIFVRYGFTLPDQRR